MPKNRAREVAALAKLAVNWRSAVKDAVVSAREREPDPIHRRTSGLSGAARLGPQEHCRDAHVLRPHHRCPIHVHRGQERLGVYQTPGAAESMQKTACTRMVGFHLVDDAGHWVQQEQPGKVTELLTRFLQDQSARDAQKR